jgi:hypothetical protein
MAYQLENIEIFHRNLPGDVCANQRIPELANRGIRLQETQEIKIFRRKLLRFPQPGSLRLLL